METIGKIVTCKLKVQMISVGLEFYYGILFSPFLLLIFFPCLKKDGKSVYQKVKHSSQNHRHYGIDIRCFCGSSLQRPYITIFSKIHWTPPRPFGFGNITNKLGHRRPLICFPVPSTLKLVYCTGISSLKHKSQTCCREVSDV